MPVLEEHAPGYSALVPHPQDLGSIRERVAARGYATPAQAYADICQASNKPFSTPETLHFP